MAFSPMTHTLKVEIVGHEATTLVPVVNVLHVHRDGSWDPSGVDAVAAAISGVINSHLADWSSVMEFDYLRATELTTETGYQVTDNTINGSAGTGSGQALPAGVCVLTKLNTSLRSRSGRGRIFWSCIARDYVDSAGTVNSTCRGLFDTLTGDINDAIFGADAAASLAVGSRKLGLSTPVTSFATEATVAFQRRRSAR